MNVIRFEWDENKNIINQNKHGISFEEASTIFEDSEALLKYDEDHSENEDRFILLGYSDKMRLLVACHCCREFGVIRIISARRATKNERKQYTERLYR